MWRILQYWSSYILDLNFKFVGLFSTKYIAIKCFWLLAITHKYQTDPLCVLYKDALKKEFILVGRGRIRAKMWIESSSEALRCWSAGLRGFSSTTVRWCITFNHVGQTVEVILRFWNMVGLFFLTTYPWLTYQVALFSVVSRFLMLG